MEWRPIPSTNGKYLASDEGMIRHRKSGRPLKIQHSRGSAIVTITLDNSHQVGRSVARLVWEAFRGAVDTDHCVVHLNGDSFDCRLDNLAMGKYGEWGRLSPDEIRSIFERAASGVTYRIIASEFNISPSHVQSILKRAIYRQVAVSPKLIERIKHREPRLSQQDADQIRRDVEAGFSQAWLARYYSVSESMISRIVNGTRWARR